MEVERQKVWGFVYLISVLIIGFTPLPLLAEVSPEPVAEVSLHPIEEDFPITSPHIKVGLFRRDQPEGMDLFWKIRVGFLTEWNPHVETAMEWNFDQYSVRNDERVGCDPLNCGVQASELYIRLKNLFSAGVHFTFGKHVGSYGNSFVQTPVPYNDPLFDENRMYGVTLGTDQLALTLFDSSSEMARIFETGRFDPYEPDGFAFKYMGEIGSGVNISAAFMKSKNEGIYEANLGDHNGNRGNVAGDHWTPSNDDRLLPPETRGNLGIQFKDKKRESWVELHYLKNYTEFPGVYKRDSIIQALETGSKWRVTEHFDGSAFGTYMRGVLTEVGIGVSFLAVKNLEAGAEVRSTRFNQEFLERGNESGNSVAIKLQMRLGESPGEKK